MKKQMTTKELTALGKDLKKAKILVLYKHGFSATEIANVMGTAESIVRKVLESYKEENK